MSYESKRDMQEMLRRKDREIAELRGKVTGWEAWYNNIAGEYIGVTDDTVTVVCWGEDKIRPPVPVDTNQSESINTADVDKRADGEFRELTDKESDLMHNVLLASTSPVEDSIPTILRQPWMPEWANWVAWDEDGVFGQFESEPFDRSASVGFWSPQGNRWDVNKNLDNKFPGDWRKSKHRIVDSGPVDFEV
jgi:hypothetical protein